MNLPPPADANPQDLVISRWLQAPRAALWRAWTDAARLPVWWCPKPWTTELLAFDLRPGGAYRVPRERLDARIEKLLGEMDLVETKRPGEGARRPRSRAQMARDVFARTLGESPIPHALVSLDYELLSMNPAGFAMTGEAAERVLGRCVFETFEGYQGEMSERLQAFYRLAVRGLKARVSNLYYDLPNEDGEARRFWSQALAWPILDDHGRILAVVNCAVSSSKPWGDGQCAVNVGHDVPGTTAS